MRIQKTVPVPRGIPVARAWATTAARRNVTTAEWCLRYQRADARRYVRPDRVPAFRMIADKHH